MIRKKKVERALVFVAIVFVISSANAISNQPKKLIKKALIFGVTGQDGSYLAELLLEKGYEVHGVKRRGSSFNTGRIDHIYQDRHQALTPRFQLHYGDLADPLRMVHLMTQIRPDEVYNLAAQSHVKVSFFQPDYTSDIVALGTQRILEAIRIAGLAKTTKFYQASSSEMFGKVHEIPQSETTRFHPRSPYGVAKVYGYWITVNYREAYGMFACNGILFNHESPRRGETFVTRKITRAVARIKKGLQQTLYIGNLEAKRDWGHAKDYVYAMWKMLNHDHPDDYVIATGETHSVREFIERAFGEIGIIIQWKGAGLDEVGYDKETNQVLIVIDPKYFRPAEVDLLIGDASKAKRVLGWEPDTSFEELVSVMVQKDIEMLENNRRC